MLTEKFSHAASELSENMTDGFWWRNRVIHRIIGPIQQKYYGNDGIDVMQQDWDNLLVLDSCRHDYFEQVMDFDKFDEYEVVESRASATPEWVQKNFLGKSFGDTVYVNANPWVSRTAPDAFHDIFDVWESEPHRVSEWHTTVLPEVLGDYARKAHEQYPNKRLVIHYNQPHGPYIGDVPLEFDMNKARGSGEALEKHLVSEEDFREAYQSNLERAESHVYDLIEDLDGRSVVTADHGELFGKRLFPIPVRAFAHPLGLRDPDLVQVPWAVSDGERRRIVDDGTQRVDIDESKAVERLREMGYHE